MLIHYGSYESTFLKQMCQRYGNPEKNSVAASVGITVESSVHHVWECLLSQLLKRTKRLC